MTTIHNDPDTYLVELAKRYVWWKTPEAALAEQTHFLAQLMTLGLWGDVMWALRALGEQAFLETLKEPPPGIFNERSWHFWHHRLNQETIPPLPQRRIR